MRPCPKVRSAAQGPRSREPASGVRHGTRQMLEIDKNDIVAMLTGAG